MRQVVERWRGAAGASRSLEDPAPEPVHAKPAPGQSEGDSAAARLDQLRAQLLKRTTGAS